MPDDLDLMQLASQGQTLARVDDVDYVRVHVVLAWAAGGVPTLYCAESDWATMPIARLAEKDRQLAELAALNDCLAALNDRLVARVAELELLRAAPPETPAQNQAAMFRAQHATLNEDSADPIVCPDCNETGWKSARALQMHRQRAHQGMQTVKAPPRQFVEELGWHCAAKGCTGAHARDLHDPDFCTLHAAPRTNGQRAIAAVGTP
jgi:hypothetical protein